MRSANRRIAALTVFAFLVCQVGIAEEGGGNGSGAFSVLKGERGNHREYYSSNKDNRFLIRVQLLGDVGLAGTHYLPDNSTLGELIGLAGGPSGDMEKGKITVTRPGLNVNKPLFSEITIHGLDIVKKPEFQNFKLQNNDIVVLDYPAKVDTLVRTLTIVGAVLGIISTGLTLYLVLKRD